jgi:hypothetical protein
MLVGTVLTFMALSGYAAEVREYQSRSAARQGCNAEAEQIKSLNSQIVEANCRDAQNWHGYQVALLHKSKTEYM